MWRGPFAIGCAIVATMAGIVYFGNPAPPKPEFPPPGCPFQIEHYETTAAGEPICPQCGRTDGIREYGYGLPGEGERPPGRIGCGCLVVPDSARYNCPACGTRFGRSPMADAMMK